MITQIKGTEYVLETENGEPLIINFDKISESEVLLALIDRVEHLMETDPMGFEKEMFENLANTLDCHFRRIRKKEINDRIQ